MSTSTRVQNNSRTKDILPEKNTVCQAYLNLYGRMSGRGVSELKTGTTENC